MTIAFNKVQVPRLKRNHFDLTHDVKLTGRIGNLIPCMIQDCIPGDSFTIGNDALIRFMPLIAPVMHRMNYRCEYFFVPNRLVWEDWQDYITQASVLALPTINSISTLTAAQQKFLDYMGIPPIGASANTVAVNALPMAAYQMIYNEYYRDQNLITPVNYALTAGDNSANGDLTVLRKRAYEHDYFTSCLPFTQKGAAIDIPIGTVELDWTASPGSPDFPHFVDANGNQLAGAVSQDASADIKIAAAGNAVAYDPEGTLVVEPVTINELRRAEALQKFFEAVMRGGSRFKEWLLNIFGVNEQDSRLQRPQFIVGVKEPIIVSEVLNTTGETGGLVQGNQAGHAVSIGRGRVGKFYCQEHGYIIGILSVLPRTAYYQGIPKHYLMSDPFDFFTPQLANIGEMAVQKQELYAYNSGAFPTATFGYLPQYTSYRYTQSRIAGDLRTSLKYWQMAVEQTTAALNQDFIECDSTDHEDIFAVRAVDDNLVIHLVNVVHAIRPVPVFGTPQL